MSPVPLAMKSRPTRLGIPSLCCHALPQSRSTVSVLAAHGGFDIQGGTAPFASVALFSYLTVPSCLITLLSHDFFVTYIQSLFTSIEFAAQQPQQAVLLTSLYLEVTHSASKEFTRVTADADAK